MLIALYAIHQLFAAAETCAAVCFSYFFNRRFLTSINQYNKFDRYHTSSDRAISPAVQISGRS